MLGFIEMMERFYTQMLSRAEAADRDRDPARREGAEFPAGREEEGLSVSDLRMRTASEDSSQGLAMPASAGMAEAARRTEHELGDLRFRALLSEAEWLALPLAIRRRFSKRLAGGSTVVYVGEVIETRMSRAGWLLAQAARLIGGPLPVSRDAHVPSVVTVTEDVGDERPALDAALRAPARLSADRAFLQALRRPDRAGGICRLRRRHGAHDQSRRMSRKSGAVFREGHAPRIRADLPRRALFRAARRLPHPAARLGERPGA